MAVKHDFIFSDAVKMQKDFHFGVAQLWFKNVVEDKIFENIAIPVLFLGYYCKAFTISNTTDILTLIWACLCLVDKTCLHVQD